MPCESDKSHPKQDYCEDCSSCHACTDEYISELKQQLADLKASLPKVRADAVRGLVSEVVAAVENNEISMKKSLDIGLDYFLERSLMRAEKLEAGNE